METPHRLHSTCARLAGLVLLASACTGEPAPGDGVSQDTVGATVSIADDRLSPQCVALSDTIAAGILDELEPALQDSLQAAGTLDQVTAYAMTPEYGDCQKLWHASGREYGPLAKIVPEDVAQTLTAAMVQQAGAGGVLIARIWIDRTNASPSSYAHLHLERGLNCVYLATQQGQPTNYEALIVPEATSQCPVSAPTTPRPNSLAVAPSGSYPGIPPLARFDWDDRTSGRMALIGFSCHDGQWCDAGPRGFVAPPPDNAHPVKRHKGRYDEQYLAIPDTAPNRLTRSDVLARIVPVDTILRIPVESYGEWVHVADVWLSENHPHYQNRGLWAGDNRLEIRKVGNTWQGRTIRIENGQAVIDSVGRVRFHPRNTGLPSAARWAWTTADEDAWVPCPNGCCEVEW